MGIAKIKEFKFLSLPLSFTLISRYEVFSMMHGRFALVGQPGYDLNCFPQGLTSKHTAIERKKS